MTARPSLVGFTITISPEVYAYAELRPRFEAGAVEGLRHRLDAAGFQQPRELLPGWWEFHAAHQWEDPESGEVLDIPATWRYTVETAVYLPADSPEQDRGDDRPPPAPDRQPSSGPVTSTATGGSNSSRRSSAFRRWLVLRIGRDAGLLTQAEKDAYRGKTEVTL